MKSMTCRQLGGACDKEFHAHTFEKIVAMSKKHALEMLMKGDSAHFEVMMKMQELMKSPSTMFEWTIAMEKEFEALPECCE